MRTYLLQEQLPAQVELRESRKADGVLWLARLRIVSGLTILTNGRYEAEALTSPAGRESPDHRVAVRPTAAGRSFQKRPFSVGVETWPRIGARKPGTSWNLRLLRCTGGVECGDEKRPPLHH